MTQDIPRNAAAAALSPREEPATGAAQAAAIEHMLLAALPQGWSVIGRCRFGTALPGPGATGCHALAHPETGIALIDIAPDATPNAESRLRRALNAADFWSDFPGYLPVWHGRLEGPAIRGLARIVQKRFSTLPPLTVPGGQAWIGAARQALAQDPAWEVPGQAVRPAAPFPPPEPEEDEEPGRGRPHALLLLGFLGTFGLGLATGLLLLPRPEAPPPAPVPAERTALADPPPAAEPPPADSPAPAPAIGAAAADPAPPSAPAPAAEPGPAEPAATAIAPPLAEPEAELLATAALRPVTPESEVPAAPAGTAQGPDLPPAPPPQPPPPAPHRAAEAPAWSGRSASGIDRTCILALFRFQQGEALSAAERAYLRNGCATRR